MYYSSLFIDVILDYNDPGPFSGKSYSDLFTNKDSSNCPLTSCVLKSADCSSTFTSSHITIPLTSDPWIISVATNVYLGWPKETFCYHCSGQALTSLSPFSI